MWNSTGRVDARSNLISAHRIIHILAIKDEEKFFAHLSLANSKTKYGGKTRIFAPVKATLKGDPVAFCAVIEFPSVKAAIDCWDDEEDYAERGNYWAIPRRTSWSGASVLSRPILSPSSSPARELVLAQCRIWPAIRASGSTTSTPSKTRRNSWPTRASRSPLFSSATMGPVVHQHVGAGATSYTVAFAALFGLESAQPA